LKFVLGSTGGHKWQVVAPELIGTVAAVSLAIADFQGGQTFRIGNAEKLLRVVAVLNAISFVAAIHTILLAIAVVFEWDAPLVVTSVLDRLT
jgi:hypothetical protein